MKHDEHMKEFIPKQLFNKLAEEELELVIAAISKAYQTGRESSTDIYDVLTSIEAARLWNFEESTVKKACQNGRFSANEARKENNGVRGRHLITRAGMVREYGPQPTIR